MAKVETLCLDSVMSGLQVRERSRSCQQRFRAKLDLSFHHLQLMSSSTTQIRTLVDAGHREV